MTTADRDKIDSAITVEVAYALPQHQEIISLTVEAGLRSSRRRGGRVSLRTFTTSNSAKRRALAFLVRWYPPRSPCVTVIAWKSTGR
jgi:hypothetical protein